MGVAAGHVPAAPAVLATGGITLAGFLVKPHLPTRRAGRPKQPDTGARADANGSSR